jgi:membrane associated rhomboid family serine protease
MIPLRDDQPSFSTPFINYFLIVLNVLAFLWELSVGTHTRALYAFTIIPDHTVAVLTGRSYGSVGSAILPLFTSMFLHGGWAHLGGNMLFLWIFGDNVEDYLGHFRFLLFYLAGGVFAAVSHILLNPGSHVPTLGASGAIAAVMGAYFILYPRARVLTWFFVFVLYLPAWLVLGYWFLLNFLYGAFLQPTNAASGIAFWAHIGGFVAGVLMIKALRERPHRHRYGSW